METIRYKNALGLTLVADYTAAVNPKALVVMAHGMTGDRKSKGRFTQIAEALNAAGFSTFAFDFAGCGESDDAVINTAGEVQDLLDTLAFVKAYDLPVVVWAHSLGVRVSLLSGAPDVKTMVLTGASAGPVHFDWETLLSPEDKKSLLDNGYCLSESSSKVRPQIKLGQQTIDSFVDFDAATVLGHISCPLLLINGDGDEEEQKLSLTVKAGMEYLPAASRHVVIAGMAHNLSGHLDEVIQLGVAWMNERFPPARE